MARLFWEDFDAAGDKLAAEGYPLSAAATVQMMRANNEAVFEEATYDLNIILPEAETCSSGWRFGPIPVPVRYDRDGLPRAIKVTPLCEGGTDSRTLTCCYYDTFRDFETSDGWKVTWTVAAAATCVWQTEQTITPPRRLSFPAHTGLADAPSGDATEDEMTSARYGYLLFKWDAVASSPVWAGLRVREVVSV